MRDVLASSGPLLIDGGLSTQLERLGHTLTDSLWTARALLDDPQAIVSAHRAFIDAGAQIITTASYQVSRCGFAQVGRAPGDADEALAASVALARDAVGDREVLVAASVGPYGAITNDGAEYRGRYGLARDELTAFHAERIEVLVAARPDLLVVETMPDLDELEAILEVLPRDLPSWISVTVADDAHLRAGQPIEEVAALVDGHPGVVALGVNCSEPDVVAPALRRLRALATLPLIAYPNAGGSWDARTHQWVAPRQAPMHAVHDWVAAGATIVGGCCGTDASDIAAMRAVLTR